MLEVEGHQPATLTPETRPFSFAADAAARARLIDGVITDLNVMTRRGRFSHKVERREVEGMLEVPPESMVFAASAGLRVARGGSEAGIGLFDMLLPEGQPSSVVGNGLVYLIGIKKL